MSNWKDKLLVSTYNTKLWEVVERPIGNGPVHRSEVFILFRTTDQAVAIAYAEGRSSATRQPVRIN